MTQPTNLIRPYTATVDQRAKLELDTERSTLLPNDYVYLLAHIPPGASLVAPFHASDGGPVEAWNGPATMQRIQAGLTLDEGVKSINLDYFPSGTPQIVFFGNEIQLDLSKLRSGIVARANVYDLRKVYTFNVIYQVLFYQLRHRPNHPLLTSQADGGVPWEEYAGDGDLSSWPVRYQVEWGF